LHLIDPRIRAGRADTVAGLPKATDAFIGFLYKNPTDFLLGFYVLW